MTAVILAPILFCITSLMLISCTPQGIKADEAIAIAKKDFGCEKILWIQDDALVLETKSGGKPTVNKMRSHYAYFVVGEKDGEEIYIVVPSSPNLDKPYITTWGLNYSFTQIVEKFNEHEAQYIAEVPDDYYSGKSHGYIWLRTQLGGLANYFDVGGDNEAFYKRLDIKAVFQYTWEIDGKEYSCIVTHENGELKAYEMK